MFFSKVDSDELNGKAATDFPRYFKTRGCKVYANNKSVHRFSPPNECTMGNRANARYVFSCSHALTLFKLLRSERIYSMPTRVEITTSRGVHT